MPGIFDFMGQTGRFAGQIGRGALDIHGELRYPGSTERKKYQELQRLLKTLAIAEEQGGRGSPAHQQALIEVSRKIKASPELKKAIREISPQQQQQFGQPPWWQQHLTPEETKGAARYQAGLAARPAAKGDWLERIMEIRSAKEGIDRETEPGLWNAFVGEETSLMEKHGMSKTDVQNEIKHRKRTAGLNRILGLAQEGGQESLVKRASAALEKENKRYGLFGRVKRKAQRLKGRVQDELPPGMGFMQPASPEIAQAPQPQQMLIGKPEQQEVPVDAYISAPGGFSPKFWDTLTDDEKLQAWEAIQEGHAGKKIENYLRKRRRR